MQKTRKEPSNKVPVQNRMPQKELRKSNFLAVIFRKILIVNRRMGQVHQLKVVGLFYAVVVSGVIIYVNHSFYHDDAYITLRYVRNFLNGTGIVWNSGEYVQGYTNFLHLIFLSFLGSLNVDLVLASRLVGFASFAGLLYVMLRFGLNFKIENKRPLWHLPAILVLTSVPLIAWSLGGLEGTLFSFLITVGSLLFVKALNSLQSGKLFAVSGAIFGLSFLTRPDSIVFIAVSSVYLLFLLITGEKKKQAFSNMVVFGALLAITVLPYVVWQLFYYGDIVPNTFYAKTGTFSHYSLLYGFYYLVKYALHPPFLPVLFLMGLFYVHKKRIWNNVLVYLSLLVFAYTIFILYAGGDHMPAARFFLPVIPLMVIVLTMVLSNYIIKEPDRVNAASNKLAYFALLILGYTIFTSLILHFGEESMPETRSFLPVVPLVVIILTMLLSHYIIKRKKGINAASIKLVFLILLIVGFINFILLVGDYMSAYRSFIVVIPLMIIILTMIFSYYIIKGQGKINVASTTIAFLLLGTLSIFDFKINPQWEDTAARVGTIVGKHIAKEWPEGSLIALSAAGATPYFAENYCYIDMLGLNDAHIGKRHVEKIELKWQRRPGHLKGDGAYVLARKPDFIIAGPAGGSLIEEPWFLSDLELSRIPKFEKEYKVEQITIPIADKSFRKGRIVFTYYKRIKSKEKGVFEVVNSNEKDLPKWLR